MRLLIAAILAAMFCCIPSQWGPKLPLQNDRGGRRRVRPQRAGQNYYPTDKLKRGQEIEVFRHDPGGWCAIRPVDGSFTWVSGRYLRPTEGHLAVITENGVSARVGSRFQRCSRGSSGAVAEG